MKQNPKPPKIAWVYPGVLARSCRPCYQDDAPSTSSLDRWMNRVSQLGIRSILCLLSEDEIVEFYTAHGLDLLASYRKQGFQVSHIPVLDYHDLPLRDQDLQLIRRALCKLPAPHLIHCSSGILRTGVAIQFIRAYLSQLQNRKPKTYT